MIGYVTLGTNDMERAGAFYDGLLAEFGARRAIESERIVFWAAGRGVPALAVAKPWDGNSASAGNGTMVALAVDGPEKVDAIHGRALALGATDDGAPGPRGENFYGAYFRDPDGNKLCVFYFGS